jgi:hypothetical protein
LEEISEGRLQHRRRGRTAGRLATSINGFDYNQDEELDDWQQDSTDSTTTKTGNSTRKAIEATGESTLTEGGSGRGFKRTFTQKRRRNQRRHPWKRLNRDNDKKAVNNIRGEDEQYNEWHQTSRD